MRDVHALELSWCEVCSIVTEEIEVILGLRVPCKINVVEGSFWDVTGKMPCLMRVEQMSAVLESCWQRT